MSENQVLVKVCIKQTDEELNTSKLCGTLKKVSLESLDKENNSNEVYIILFIDIKIFYLNIILQLEIGSTYHFRIRNHPIGSIESFLCEVMAIDTDILRTTRGNKRNGTHSDSASMKIQNTETLEDEEEIEINSQDDQDVTSDEDEDEPKDTHPNVISPSRIRELNKALIDCIIRDKRPIDDFHKPGMLEFLNVLVPGYKPPEIHVIAKEISRRLKKYRKQK